MNVFDYVKSITYLKQEVEDLSSYVPFIVNKALSYYPDTVFYANEMNISQNVPEKMQYLFLLNSISKAKRFSKWEKKEEIENFTAVKLYFGYSDEQARQAMKILDTGQIELIKSKLKGIKNE
jgi:hypothetical protein